MGDTKPGMRDATRTREGASLAAHRAAFRGSELPPPNEAAKGTFVHGFLQREGHAGPLSDAA